MHCQKIELKEFVMKSIDSKMRVVFMLVALVSLLEVQVEARAQELHSESSSYLGDFVRDANGGIRSMTQTEAVSYCKSQGQRLPTVRELALYAQSLGAQGISETEKVGYTLM